MPLCSKGLVWNLLILTTNHKMFFTEIQQITKCMCCEQALVHQGRIATMPVDSEILSRMHLTKGSCTSLQEHCNGSLSCLLQESHADDHWVHLKSKPAIRSQQSTIVCLSCEPANQVPVVSRSRSKPAFPPLECTKRP